MQHTIELLHNLRPEIIKEYAWYVQLYGNILDKLVIQILLDWPLLLAVSAVVALATWVAINRR